MMENKKNVNQLGKKFEEERARLILICIFPEKYKDSYLTESPDIVNTSLKIGVEVTDSMKSNVQESISRAGEISGKHTNALSKVDQKNIEKRRVNAHALENGIMLASTNAFWGKCYDFERIFNIKQKKLNAPHFQKFEENNLFIFAWMIDEDELRDAIIMFEDISSNKVLSSNEEYTFDLVYIFAESCLIEIHLKDFKVQRVDMNKEALHSISHEAFKNVFGMSKEEYMKLKKDL